MKKRAMFQHDPKTVQAGDATNPKNFVGITKAPLRLVPPVLEILTSVPFAIGAKKYGAFNWREAADGVRHSIYLEAARRHLDAILDGEAVDAETGVEHEASVAACMAIIMDARAIGKLVHDLAPVAGGAPKELLRVASLMESMGLARSLFDVRPGVLDHRHGAQIGTKGITRWRRSGPR